MTDQSSKDVALSGVKFADKRYLRAKTLRDEAIRDAYDAGYSLREIAAHLSLSHESVRQIVRTLDATQVA